MKKIITSILFVVVAISSTGFISYSKNSGGIAGYTGSPGEGKCNSCHSGGASIASSATIISTPSFTANQYVPGTTYIITIGVGAVGFSNFGFGAEILGSTNANIGIMQNAGTGVQFLNAGNGRKNATQTSPKNGTTSVNFTFEWVAPLSGAATIYVCGNAVNLSGGTSGDLANISTSLALTAAPTIGLKENTNVLVSEINISPNPVSDIMSVSYLLTKSQDINIQLIDINGKVIKQLTNQNQTAGFHTSTNSISDVTKGVYFVKVISDNEKVAQKLIVVN
jgi:hypothetical protein